MRPAPSSAQSSRDGRSGAAPLHVVHGLFFLDVGGLERVVIDLVAAGRRAGHRVSVVCLERPGAMAGRAQELGATVVCLDKPPGPSPKTTRAAAAALAGLRPDVLHSHQIGALWYLGRPARQAGIPVLHTEHGNHLAMATNWRARLKTWLFWRRAATAANQFCCVSDDIAQAVTRWHIVPQRDTKVIPNGIRTEIFADQSPRPVVREEAHIPAEVPVVGTVGRLNEVKRQDLLLQATARLRGRFPGLHLMLVGDGPERARLEREAAELGIREFVRFAGCQPNPERFLSAMDVFALTSRSEGLPVALLEAWAAGLPVVSSAVGGIPKIVTQDVNGLLFRNGNVAALTAALAALLAQPEQARRLGDAGRAVVRTHYSLETMAAEYEGGYRQLLQSPQGVG
ncbi:MAG: glycosyltransferase [Gemmataceae bacterium]